MDMKLRRTTDEAADGSDVVGKLSLLLRTEAELERMLAEARLEAEQRVEAARQAGAEKVARFERDIEAELMALRSRVERDLAASVEEIRKRAEAETASLDAIDDTTVERLAHELLYWLTHNPDEKEAR